MALARKKLAIIEVEFADANTMSIVTKNQLDFSKKELNDLENDVLNYELTSTQEYNNETPVDV